MVSNDPNWPFYKLSFEGTVLGDEVSLTTNHTNYTEGNTSNAVGAVISPSATSAPPRETPSSANQEPFDELRASQEPSTKNQALRTPVRIDYFYEAGCPDCRKVREQIMPILRARFPDQYDLRRHDVGIMSNVVMLVAYQEKLGIKDDRPVCMVVDYQHVFNGFDVIKSGLVARVESSLAEQSQPDWKPPVPIEIPADLATGIDIAESRMKSFTLPAVALAGLIDGLNPCAIGTLVFFMSLLAVFKIRASRLLLVGIVFCLASFVTYTAIGFGLLRILHGFAVFPAIQRAVEIVMTLVLAIFAFLSFRDAYRFRISGAPGDVTLQLPDSIKNRIHKIMRGGLNARSLVAGAFVTGVLVTALESVCTGQVYVPTLVLVVKTHSTSLMAGGRSVFTGLQQLLLYNAMFIVPLVIAFIVAYRGLKTEALIQWSTKNVVPSKILLGLLFVVMAVLIWVV